MALGDPVILDDTLLPPERRVVNALAGELKSHFGGRLERVAVFGSRARGDVTLDSDIDVLIVLRMPAEQERVARGEVWELITRARALAPDAFVPVSPVVFSLERFEE